ncbi:hypothetical protein ABK040_007591 [Willaertia magna]
MPVVNVKRDNLLQGLSLPNDYTQSDFEQLCFDFGIELDDVTSEKQMKEKEGLTGKELENLSDEIIYKIEVPANRYDILCEEGLTRALNIFLKKSKNPAFVIDNSKIVEKNGGELIKIFVKKETNQIRPFVVGAVLRNITFTENNYNNFIDLQDKLHQNICRKRTLVAIGTHDLDSLEGPNFSYEALAPADIRFVPLNQQREMNAKELFEFIEKEEAMKHLRSYLKIIKDSPVYPVIYDKKRTVLSLPPIINGDHSKIKLTTKNVLIECTATDLTKAHVVLNTMVCMFSQYCDKPFTVEQVQVIYEDESKCLNEITPNLMDREFTCNIKYINERIGVNLKIDKIVKLLGKMQLEATIKENEEEILVKVPPTRSDILHACDIMEDVAIAYGYNKIIRTNPKTSTVGKELPINQLSDLLRLELAMSGYTEVLTLILCSEDENFKFMNKVNDGNTAIKVSSPKSLEFSHCRTSLISGLMKTVQNNKSLPLPIQLFEISDVVLVDKTTDVGAKNVRKLAALYASQTSGLEYIHGLMDRIMEVLGIPFEVDHDKAIKSDKPCYSIKPSEDSSFFNGRQAHIYYMDKKVGIFGILHPIVIESFKLALPVSVLEIDVEAFL